MINAVGPTGIPRAMTLDIAQPQIELLGQRVQHWAVDQTTQAIAMQKMQHRLAARWAMPATQGEVGFGRVGPG